MPLHDHVLNEFSVTAQIGPNASEQIGPQRRATAISERALDRYSCGFALQHGFEQVYNEEAFHYFLEIERKRSEISNRPFLLMLIDLKKHSGFNSQIDAVTAGKVFLILSRSLRETDFIGWYREGCVAGAVLTQYAEPVTDLSELVRLRLDAELGKHFRSYRTRGLQIRVYQVSPKVKFRNE